VQVDIGRPQPSCSGPVQVVQKARRCAGRTALRQSLAQVRQPCVCSVDAMVNLSVTEAPVDHRMSLGDRGRNENESKEET